jgi:hypothetical protein
MCEGLKGNQDNENLDSGIALLLGHQEHQEATKNTTNSCGNEMVWNSFGKIASVSRTAYDLTAMTDDRLIKGILDEAFYVHKNIGPGLLEKTYQTILAYRLNAVGFKVEIERAIPVFSKK